MSNPLFSIIIPTYNRAELLNRALDSLAQQTYKNFEVFVCDDGSTDNTNEIVHSFKDKIKVTHLWIENTGGPARPRNIGIENSVGEWICFLDSDDFWTKEKLEKCIKYLDNSDLIHHNLFVFGDTKYDKTPQMISRQLSKSNSFKDLLINWNVILISSVIVRKSIINEVGLFDEDLNISAVADFDMWIRIAQKTNRFKLIAENLGYYNIDVGSMTSDIQMLINAEFFIFEKYKCFYSKKEVQLVENLIKFNAGLYYLKKGDKRTGNNYFKDAFFSKSKINIKIKSLFCLIFGFNYFKLIRIYSFLFLK